MELIDYGKWKNCIVKNCGIPLTREFIESRLAELLDDNHIKTIQFKERYGIKYIQVITNHFKRALEELGE